MNNKYIVCLGYRAGLIRQVTQRGLAPFIIATKVKPGLEDFQYCLVENLEDAQEVLRALSLMMPMNVNVVGVITGHEEGVFTAAIIRDCLNLPGPRSYQSLLRFRDKHLQKSLLRDAVPCAKSMYVSHGKSYADVVSSLGSPFVIKPANGAGSKRTQLIYDKSALNAFLTDSKTNSDIALVAESAIQGAEYCVDGLWENGQLIWFTVCQYNTNPINYHRGKSLAAQILSNLEYPSLYQRASKLIIDVMNKLVPESADIHTSKNMF